MHFPSHKRNVSVIGAGKVGSTIAILLRRNGYKIISVISQRKTSAKKLSKLVRCTQYSKNLSEIHPSTDILVLAVPEDNLLTVAREIAKAKQINFKHLYAFHTSGALSSKVLRPLERKGTVVFSLHPIQTFPKKMNLSDQIQRMKNVCYGFEGPTKAYRIASEIVKRIRGHIVRISIERKILYHIVCVFASNFSIVLLGVVNKLLKHIGGGLRIEHLQPLVVSSISNSFRLNPEKALTGPIIRGSFVTVRNHLKQLTKTNKSLIPLYKQLSLQALSIAEHGKYLKSNQRKKINQLLN
jgi:predicted short-subunit dehydrogenase-like oxidoreductase (DUF2520 family)